LGVEMFKKTYKWEGKQHSFARFHSTIEGHPRSPYDCPLWGDARPWENLARRQANLAYRLRSNSARRARAGAAGGAAQKGRVHFLAARCIFSVDARSLTV